MTNYSAKLFPEPAPSAYAATIGQYAEIEPRPPAVDPADWARRQQADTFKLVQQQAEKTEQNEDLSYWHTAWNNSNAWIGKAACQGTSDHGYPFYPPSDGRNERSEDKDGRVALAQRICNSCPVIKECLGFAVKHGEKQGIWAGYNLERAKQRQKAIAQIRQFEEALIEKASQKLAS